MQRTALERFTELLAQQSSDGLAGLAVLLDEVWKIERAHAPEVAIYQQIEQRIGHTN